MPHNSHHSKAWTYTLLLLAVLLIGAGYFFINNFKDGGRINVGTDAPNDFFYSGEGLVETLDDEAYGWKSDEIFEDPNTPDSENKTLRQKYCEQIGYAYSAESDECYVYSYYNSYDDYKDEEGGFTVYYPALLWDLDPNPTDIKYTKESSLYLRRHGTYCEIRYGQIDERSLMYSGIASVGKVIDTDLTKIALSYPRLLTEDEKKAGFINHTIIAVPHFPNTDSKYGFILSTTDNRPLFEACADEFEYILTSQTPNYPDITISEKSNGIVALEEISSQFERNAGISQKTAIIFTDSETQKNGIVSTGVFNDQANIEKPFLSGDSIYFLTGHSNQEIKSVNIKNGQSKALAIGQREESEQSGQTSERIHSFYVKNGNLYYAEGGQCDGSAETEGEGCEGVKLKQYNLETNEVVTLTEKLNTTEIVAVDSKEEKIISHIDFGSSGCAGKYQSFNISSGEVEELGQYTDCQDKLLNLKLRNLISGSNSYSYFVVKNGGIYLPKSDGWSVKNRIKIRVNLDEYGFE